MNWEIERDGILFDVIVDENETIKILYKMQKRGFYPSKLRSIVNQY